MKTLKELYRIGRGPSSSHTIGPETICNIFLNENSKASSFKVVLYGSLAKTGIGHGTDRVCRAVLKNVEIVCDYKVEHKHPNTMDLYAYENGIQTAFMRAYSVGGGEIVIEGREKACSSDVYNLSTFKDISSYVTEKNMRLCDYVYECEGQEIKQYLKKVWQIMVDAIKRGISTEGVLPGGLNTQRKALKLYNMTNDEGPESKEDRIVCSYAFAVSEENASANPIVTAPTCGSCGIMPAVLYYMQQVNGYTDDEIIDALATAGIIGNLIKTNASISGAECGCQAEVGSACAMAAAALGQLKGFNVSQIEYASEIAIEHHLGLTCDPICGLVQIPCIERNAVAAMRAINAVRISTFLYESRKISFDMVVQTMYETGVDIKHHYRETAEGGLAKLYRK